MSENYANKIATNESSLNEYEIHDYRLDHIYKIKSISVLSNPTKIIYLPGELFDESGMVIQGIYEDEDGNEIQKVITGFRSSQNPITLDQNKVIIIYTENNISLTTQVNITVSNNIIIPPIVESTAVYDNTVHSPIVTYAAGTQQFIDQSGISSGINAGNYVLIFKLKPGCVWSDSLDNENKYITWTIEKANQVVSIDSTKIILSSEHTTVSRNFTHSIGDGDIILNDTLPEFTSSTKNLNSISITYLDEEPLDNQQYQNCEVQLIAQETQNYKQLVISLFVSCYYQPTLENASWGFINNVSKPGYINNIYYPNMAAYYWDIGDYKSYKLNGVVGDVNYEDKEFYAYIISFLHDSGTTFATSISPNSFESDSFHKAIAFTDSHYGNQEITGKKVFNINHSNIPSSIGGWKGCDLRYDILGSTNIKNSDPEAYDIIQNPVENTFMAALPLVIRENLHYMELYTDNVGTTPSIMDNHVSKTIDYLPLLSAVEIYGNSASSPAGSHVHPNELLQCSQYEYFASGAPATKYKMNSEGQLSLAYCWLRSPEVLHGSDYQYFCVISGDQNTPGELTSAYTSISDGISFMFLLKSKEV